MKRTEVFY